MFLRQIKLLIKIFLLLFLVSNSSFSEVIKEIQVIGNERVSNETIKMFGSVSVNQNLEKNQLNDVLKRIYSSNFFDDVEISFKENVLKIKVVEKPIIINIKYNGIKSNELRNIISENRILKPRSSFDETSLKKDETNILSSLKSSGYYFSKINSKIEILENNKLNLIYDIELGEKSKIKKISFIGNKIFKDKKLRSVIISEETKFWKFISGRKFLNSNIINLDKRLLRNFYLNKGYKNVEINSSFAKLINQNEFELIFNINANEKIYFNDINLELPVDFKPDAFKDIYKFFDKVKGEPYSLVVKDKIIKEIEIISLSEQYVSSKITVKEKLVSNKLNLSFSIEESEKFFVEKINIFGNNITVESVIRNQLLLDEGDPFNDILYTKSINEIKSLNFFKETKADIIDGKNENSKIINIYIEEKPTGEISLGAGAGTSGTTIGFAVKENNFLGKGINFTNSLSISDETIRGQFKVSNPNYKNSDKAVNFGIEALEIDRAESFGYKTNKTGFSFGTGFEYLQNLNLNIDFSNYYEKISTDGTASALQKTQEGNYWDTFLNLDFDYDKRNQKFETTGGFRSYFSTDLPLISDTNTLSNTFNYKYYTELYENNVSTASFMLRAANSISGDNIKLSERLFIPSYRLRGFENGKIGPKDGNDYIGGNFLSAINFTSTVPQILSNYQNMDIVLFLDAANVWGVDYSSSIDDGNAIRSSVGVGVDWFTVVGPLNFSLAQPILKESSDKTESFRFNLGTTF